MKRLVCVSNRVSLPRRAAAPGGLAVGVSHALRQTGGLWFGWSGEVSDAPGNEADLHTRSGLAFATLDLTREQVDGYYNGFANSALWPLFHYFVRDFRYSAEHYEQYQAVNRLFARRLRPLLRPGDLVWVHDYHLIPLARMLREEGCDQPLGLFLHTPFPCIDVLRVLPTHAELVRDLLTFDVVGFQTEDDLRAFAAAAAQLYGHEAIGSNFVISSGDRRTRAGVFPIGVDVDGVQSAATDAAGSQTVRRMVDSLLDRRLMIGVDRLDYSKGLVERFASYQQFLETYPDNLGRITYLQIAPVSRGDIPAYSEIRQSLEQAAGRTNGLFADTDWTPIRYLNRDFPHPTMMGFLRAANVALVTPLRDGMNLVAKEFVAAQDADNPGVLVLSTLAGAARELAAAVQVNPYDTRAVSRGIQTALDMPLGERRERHASMMETLRRNDIHAWTRRFVDALRETRSD